MSVILTTWKPSLRNIVFSERPEWVDPWVYTQAVAAKRTYNERWEFWVYRVSQDYNCPLPEAEDACIRGIQKEINRQYLVHGPKVGKWFEEFLDMGDLFRKVQHPIYLPRLGD